MDLLWRESIALCLSLSIRLDHLIYLPGGDVVRVSGGAFFFLLLERIKW